tara:strand:- start:2002 stop:2658 length:657 start_codon:yes stop_codon:yes gene_type:complete
MASDYFKSAAKYGAMGAQIGGLAGPGGAAAGAGLGAAGGIAYEMFNEDPYEDRIAKRIRELEMQEAGLTPQEMALYRQSMNAPAIEEAAASEQRRLAAIATQGGDGNLFRQIQQDEQREAYLRQKTELGLMGASLQADAEKERELDRLHKEQAGLAEDPTEDMLAFADEVEYQVQGAAQETAMQEAMLNFLQGEGMDGSPAQKEELMGFVSWLGSMGA